MGVEEPNGKEDGQYLVKSNNASIQFDKNGNIRQYLFRDQVFEPPIPSTVYEIEEQPTEAEYLPGLSYVFLAVA